MSNLFDNLSPEEQKLFEAYDNTIASGEMYRTDDEKIFDKLHLLGQARLRINTSRTGKKIDKEFIEKQLRDLKKAPPNYNKTGEWTPLNTLISKLYDTKKFANYDRSAYGMYTSNDRTGCQTAKGREFTDYLTLNDFQGQMNIIDKENSGWIFRTPKNFIKGKIDHRYALNAIPDKELIRKLDEFTAKHKMHYKTCRPRNWYDRNDSVVIYCSNPQTAEEIAELKKIAAPYIRRDKPSRTNDLDGELIADGIVTAKEVDRQQCAELYHKINKINPFLAQEFKETVDKNIFANPNNPLSLGQFQNYTNLLDTFIAESNKAQQRTARTSIRDTHSLDQHKTSQQSHKDMAQFIKDMRNGNNAALQQMPPAASAQTTENQPSLSELIEKGIDVNLSEKSRLSFAPDIENLRVSKDKYGVLHMQGISKDGKQSIDFSVKDGNIQFETKDGEVARSYNNKLAGKWTWRNLKSPSGTRHFDQNGEEYAKEMAAVMDKIKRQYQTRAQQNAHVSDMEIAKDGGR